MRNLVLIFATLLCVYLYKHPRVETRETPAPPPRLVERVLPAPKAPARTYYHSPLDAGAMSTSASTGSGYISTDPESRFRNGYYGGFNGYNGSGSYGSAYGSYPYYGGGGGGVVSNNVTYNINGGGGATSAARPQLPNNYVAGRVPAYPPNSSGGIAR